MATFLANQINSTWGDITGQTVHVQIMFPLRWLKTVPSTFQDSLSVDVTIMVSKDCPIIGEHVYIIFMTL